MNFLILVAALAILSWNGIVITCLISPSKNKLLLLGMGMILGPLGYLLTLGVFSYVLKGPIAIQIMFWGYFLLCVNLFKKTSLKFPISFRGIARKDIFCVGVPIFLYVFLIFLFGSNYEILGDADVWFGIATSFVRGNYPVVLPWQPDFLTIYHTGTFLVEGALHSLSSMNILAVHTFFSSFLVSAIFLFVTGLAREKTRSIVSFFPAVLGLILFGGPLILVSGHADFLKELFVNLPTAFSETVVNLSNYPQLWDTKATYGGGPMTILDLLMKSYYTFGLGTFLIFIYLLCVYPWKKSLRKKYAVLALLTGLLASTDESFFVFAIVLLGFSLVSNYWKKRKMESFKLILMAGVILGVILLTVQNNMRDSFFTPHFGIPRFKLILPGIRQKSTFDDYEIFSLPRFELMPSGTRQKSTFDDNEVFYRYTSDDFVEYDNFDYLKTKLLAGKEVFKSYKGTKWYLPSIYLIALIVIIASIFFRSKLALTLGLTSLLSTPLTAFIIYTFNEFTSYRFLDKAYHLLTFAIGFLLLDLFSLVKKNGLTKVLVSLIVGLVFIPNLVTSHAFLLKGGFFWRHMANFKKRQYYYHDTLEEVSKKVPFNKRVLFIDEKYPLTSGGSSYIAQAYMNFGLLTPISPPSPKVLNPEGGGEWYDVALSLSPSAMKKLKVDYVYIAKKAPERFTDIRRKQLDDASYFDPIYIDRFGILYKVTAGFKDLPEDGVTLDQIASLIPDDTTVYFDTFSANEIRRGLTLSLAKRVKLIGPKHNAAGGDFFMYIEDILPFYRTCEHQDCSGEVDSIPINYAIMKTGIDPGTLLSGSFEKVIEAVQVSLWENGFDENKAI